MKHIQNDVYQAVTIEVEGREPLVLQIGESLIVEDEVAEAASGYHEVLVTDVMVDHPLVPARLTQVDGPTTDGVAQEGDNGEMAGEEVAEEANAVPTVVDGGEPQAIHDTAQADQQAEIAPETEEEDAPVEA